MFTEIKTNKEFHKNGVFYYIETIAIINPECVHLFERAMLHPSGYYWIRQGVHEKYFDNGQIARQLNYDKTGTVIQNKSPSYRKDGSVIIY